MPPITIQIDTDSLIDRADTDPMASALADGRLVATVVSLRTGEHITVQAKCRRAPDQRGGRWTPSSLADATHVFVDVPRSGDGMSPNDKVATYRPDTGALWPDRAADPARVWAAAFMLRTAAGLPASDQAEILLGTECFRCGRELTDPESIQRGVGPECARKETRSRHQRKQRTLAGVAA